MKSGAIWQTGLPALEIADEVNAALASNANVVVTAPPGAGKSTVLPLTILQGLAEASGITSADCGKVLVLEPRRIAARQIAERMAWLSRDFAELADSPAAGGKVGGLVGYRVRFESHVSAATRVEVLTEGILTRMIVEDPTLDGVSAIIFDEFHERSINCDLALAMALHTQRIIRPDLKIVVMSATIDASEICSRFGAPLIESEGRLFPITDIYGEAIQDIRDIAATVARNVLTAYREQEGGILAFLPGEADIVRCASLLQEALPEAEIFPLYGMMPFEKQNLAIAPCRDGGRKIVLATPIAETSLTIEDVRVVVDSGLYRRQVVDPQTGLGRLETARISRDMADQRRGRAGRVAPGVCYRLWQRGEESQMKQCRVPEILEADLAPMLLQVAAWGGCASSELDWMSAPPPAALSKAEALLQLLGALDERGAITSHGRRLAAMPCHPRIANMLVGEDSFAASGGSSDAGALAADIAALLDERDPMARAATSDSDISGRIARLRQIRAAAGSGRDFGSGRGNFAAGGRGDGRWENILRGAAQYRKLAGVAEDNSSPDPYQVGALLARAYPERIARQQKDGCGHYLLANGERAAVDRDDLVAAYDWIAVANMNSIKGGEGRIFLAAPLDPESVPELIRSRERLSWDARKGAVVAVRERNIGCLNVDSRPLTDVSADAVLQALREAAPKYGLTMFDFSEDVANLQRRVAAVALWHPELELPDLSTEVVLACAERWLPAYFGGAAGGGGSAANVASLRRIDLCAALWSLLDWDQQQAVDRIAPRYIEVASGSRIPVEYRVGAENPILRVRIQECFGMADSPRVDGGRRPVLLELLSPGFKPVQLTSDLRSFWAEGYFEVRKELRRRYPKHFWPDNPLESEARRGVRR